MINASSYGMYVTSSNVAGDVINNGSVAGVSYGVVVSDSNVAGDVVNTGNISASNTGLGVWYSATVAGDVVNDGTINAQYGVGIYSATVNGAIVNNGTINSTGTGVYVENTSTVAGGITNSGTIQGSNYAIYVDSSSTVSDINIVGTQSHLIGDVYAQNTDVNVTSGAVFTSEGGFDVQSFNVANGATFNMADDITVTGGLNNSGVVSLADASLMTITGDYLGAGGVLRTNVSSASSYGQLAVTGTAAVGAVDVALAPGATIASGDVLADVLVSSSAPLSGMPSVTDNSVLWNFSAIDNGSNGFDLTTSMSSTVGEDVPALMSGQNLQATGALLDSVLDVVESGSKLSGLSSGDAMVSAPGKLWVKGYGSSSDRSNDAGVYGYDADGRGTVIGADTSLSDGLVVGGAIAYGTNNVDGKDGLSGHHIDSDVFQAIAYTGKDLGNSTYFTAQGVYGSANNDGTRQFSDLGLMQEAKSDFDSWFTNLRGEYGKNYTSGDLTITPNANISYVYINQDSFTEKGSTLNEHVKEYDGDSLVVGAGANLAYRIQATPKQNVILTGHLGAGYDFMNNTDNVKFTIAGGPATEFTSQGADQDEWVIRGGVGVKTDGIGPFEIGVNYDIQSSSNYDGGVFSATAKYKF
ncbi:MAG TPA: autotransporter domain-containing protein [Pseudomonadales bacterium]|nr:autotransporter domain-containing protein [Pseudomonadales bacterium]